MWLFHRLGNGLPCFSLVLQLKKLLVLLISEGEVWCARVVLVRSGRLGILFLASGRPGIHFVGGLLRALLLAIYNRLWFFFLSLFLLVGSSLTSPLLLNGRLSLLSSTLGGEAGLSDMLADLALRFSVNVCCRMTGFSAAVNM